MYIPQPCPVRTNFDIWHIEIPEIQPLGRLCLVALLIYVVSLLMNDIITIEPYVGFQNSKNREIFSAGTGSRNSPRHLLFRENQPRPVMTSVLSQEQEPHCLFTSMPQVTCFCNVAWPATTTLAWYLTILYFIPGYEREFYYFYYYYYHWRIIMTDN